MNQKQSPNLLQSYLDVLQAKQFNPLPLPSQTILPNSPVLGKKRPYTSHNSPPEATKMKEQQNDFFQSVSMKNLPVEEIDANNFTSVRRRTLNSDVPKPYEWKDFIKIKCLHLYRNFMSIFVKDFFRPDMSSQIYEVPQPEAAYKIAFRDQAFQM